ncbi:SDR family NAD(P)-dependent oxidoreductase [Mesorhizobium sp. M1E.F.Ca.ET.045.02.1.1]|nr:SDR family NAD(P)-dependent oxidoreductase [Mesorhizobium sp. M1E.F.Ca.ET.045.02.1.1]RUW21461.1 SDR family NAD(P)-dependent oxidoreductase [Mesorhizobium sp. M1E.F.Ca.ET.041.01.1.1]RUW85574.1 SDR family NAD(P)-dependent oxidoreductase [Mesorhizobium sp. M1E.F.Ca.ET.063.01.1.1]RWD88719.1 MAG: SDR family NAD(P)-dependent oxidoreductase [Mesorhizobium sp.]RWD92892.1 MAG: SDR family NAD(P)-dependent oxidoreductase [Mesorhizobium sp.]
MRLAGKVAIVTGGGSGFGEGIVNKFVAEGASVVLMDRDEAAAVRVSREAGDKVRPITGDVSTLESFAAAADLARSAFGGLDILVNNAGVAQPPLPLETMDEGLFDRIANVNMRSIYNGARAVVPHFKSVKSGAILNVASTGGVSPGGGDGRRNGHGTLGGGRRRKGLLPGRARVRAGHCRQGDRKSLRDDPVGGGHARLARPRT